MNSHRYWGYGLNILSEIEFPELLPYEFTDMPDLNIRLDNAPETITGENVVHKVRVSISPDQYLLKVRDVAHYYASNGNQIIIQPLPSGDEKSIRLFLLSNGIAAILHQRNMIPLHASAIEYGDGLILFCGQSGAGKSTTVSALQKIGYTLFSDDVCVLKYPEVPGSAIEALPSSPVIKLWHDTYEKVGIELGSEDNRLRPESPKYARFYHEKFSIMPQPVNQVFIIDKYRTVGDPEIEKLDPLEAFAELQKNSYRYMQMNSMKKRDVHFSIISALTKTSGVYKISRPVGKNTVQQIIDLVISSLPKNV